MVAMAALACMACGGSGPKEDTAPNTPSDVKFVPGELLVKFDTSTGDVQARSAIQEAGLERVDYFEDIGVYRCRTGTQTVESAMAACASDSRIVYAEPNYIYTASELPDDIRFPELWAMRNANDADIDADEAWDKQTGSSEVVVAIIDTGVDRNHEDLQDNIWHNPGESGEGRETNGVDDDGNGFVDDVYGWDFVNDDNDPFDDNAHGTHVAGTIAAIGNNGTGVVGVNWRASVMALKFLSANGSGSSNAAIQCILYAARNGARVQNNSWGGGGFSQALQDAIVFARDQGVVFVAAAGNEGRNNDTTPSYPSNYEVANVVAVAASDRNDQVATFSNTGLRTVDLAAPGVGILSTTPGNTYQSFDGTSMATPHVSGVLALVAAQYPDLGYRELMVRVVGAVERKSAFSTICASGGRLNAARALSTDPKVAFVTRLADTPNPGPYPVQAEATDDGRVASVELMVSVNGSPTTTHVMQPVGNAYSFDIPSQADGDVLSYFVVVTDDAGNTAQSATFSFRVGAGGDQPTPPGCGNFAVALGNPSSNRDGLVALIANIALLGGVAAYLRRRYA